MFPNNLGALDANGNALSRIETCSLTFDPALMGARSTWPTHDQLIRNRSRGTVLSFDWSLRTGAPAHPRLVTGAQTADSQRWVGSRYALNGHGWGRYPLDRP